MDEQAPETPEVNEVEAAPVAEPEAAPQEEKAEASQVPEAEAVPEVERRPFLTSAMDWLRRGNWVYPVIVALVIAALVLPPISLTERLGLVGCVRLDSESPMAALPDGLVISLPEGSAEPLRVRLEAITQLEFLEGSAGADLRAAAAAIPEILQVKSPFFSIRPCSRSSGPAVIEVSIPDDVDAPETLDLYTWTGEAWRWVGGVLDPDRRVLRLEAQNLPTSLVVMETAPVVPSIGTVLEDAAEVPEAVTVGLVPGLYLGTDGVLLGEVGGTTGESGERLLLVRNWHEGEPVNSALLNDLLSDPALQAAHIEAVVQQAKGWAAGVALDFRGVAAEQRDTFSSFVRALTEALHAEGLRLEVVVPAPEKGAAGWVTGGYDWAALGQAADALIFPLPADPAAYVEDGEVDDLLRWAVGQVDRYRLRAWTSSLSVDIAGETVRHLGLEEALTPFGQVTASVRGTVEPGDEVVFTLTGDVKSIVRDEVVGTYVITYEADEGSTHTVWLGTPAFLARKLDRVLRYHLGGVVLADLLAEGNMVGVMDAVEAYRVAAQGPTPTELTVIWGVEGPEGWDQEEVVALSQPDFRWVAPEQPGSYTVSASIAGVERGSVRVTVATPTPTPTPTPAALTEEEAACLRAAFVQDVTVPDGTQFDNGEVFTKTWRLRNSGTCDWPEGTVLAFVSGSQMDGPGSVPVGAVGVGETVDISVPLVAPQEPGRYTGLWALRVGETEIAGGQVTVVIQAGEVAAAPSPGTAPPAAGAGGFELGGHIRDLGFPYANLMHYAGMTWAKVQVHYGQDATGIIQAAHANGFKIQLSALGTPSMVTQPGFEQDFANWVAGLAAAGADAIEVWNEPNIDREWQAGYIDPAAYTRLLCTAYNAIKAANPSTIVISAAPAPTGYFGGCSPFGCDDKPFLEGMYNAGAAPCMDYIGAHHNSGATSPSARIGHPADPTSTHHSWFFLPQTELYYNIFRGTRQLFYTEMGYASQEGVPLFTDCSDWAGPCSSFAWARGTDNSEQAAWLAEAVQLSINTGMVRCIIVWNIDFPRYGYDPQDGYAIVRPDGSCPACEALHAILGTR